jgi:hypothetical protein
MKLIKGKWWTETTVAADSDGRAKFRGTFGHYDITVKVSGREAVVRKMELQKGGSNQVVVRTS